MVSIKVKNKNPKGRIVGDLYVFLYPLLIIIGQSVTIMHINLSWIISLFSVVYIIKYFKGIFTRYIILMMYLLLSILYSIISSLWSISSYFNFSLFISLLTGMICLIFIISLNKQRFYIFLNGCCLATFVIAIWGVFEVYTGNYILFRNTSFIYNMNRYAHYYPGVTFANTNDLSQFLCVLCPLSFMIIYRHKSRKLLKIILEIVLVLCSFIVIYNSLSRLSIISLFSIIILLFIFELIYSKKKLTAIIILLCMILIAILVNQSHPFWSDLKSEFLNIDNTSQYYTYRDKMYKDLFYLSLKRPYGAGFGSAYTLSIIGPHNMFLFILCDYGFVFAIIFIVFLISLFIRLLSKPIRINSNYLSTTLAAILLLFPFYSSISSANEQRKIIWIILGICIAMVKLSIMSINEVKYD